MRVPLLLIRGPSCSVLCGSRLCGAASSDAAPRPGHAASDFRAEGCHLDRGLRLCRRNAEIIQRGLAHVVGHERQQPEQRGGGEAVPDACRGRCDSRCGNTPPARSRPRAPRRHRPGPPSAGRWLPSGLSPANRLSDGDACGAVAAIAAQIGHRRSEHQVHRLSPPVVPSVRADFETRNHGNHRGLVIGYAGCRFNPDRRIHCQGQARSL